MISDLQQRISAALRKGKRQVEDTGAAVIRDHRRAMLPARAYEVRETCGGVTRSWVEFRRSNAGGGR
jgi:hypothetical protein